MHHQRIIGPYGRMGDMSSFALEPFWCQGNQMMSELKRTANCRQTSWTWVGLRYESWELGDQRRRPTPEIRTKI